MRTGLVLMLTALLAGCSSWPWRPTPPELPLLPPAELGRQWQLTQSVTMIPLQEGHRQTSHTLLAAWSVTAGRLDLAGLTPAGQTLLTVSYDGRELHSQRSPLLPGEVSPRDILVQLQLSYWPLDSISRALAGTPWRVEEANGVRQLWRRQHKVLSIERQILLEHSANTALGHSKSGALESVTLTHHQMHYQLQIQTLTREALDAVDQPGPSGTLK